MILGLFDKLKKYDNDGYDERGFDKNGIHKDTRTEFDRRGFDKNGIHKHTRTEFDRRGFDKNGIHKHTRTEFDRRGFDKNGIHKHTRTKYDERGFDEDGYDEDGFNERGLDRDEFNWRGMNNQTYSTEDQYGRTQEECNLLRALKKGYDDNGFLQLILTGKFREIISKKYSDFSRIITIAYDEPTRMNCKLFFGHENKIGIYSKEFQKYSKYNVIHINISHSNKQTGSNWIKPKDTGRVQGDNFESGYTLEIYFEYNDRELKKNLIEKLNKMGFGSLPSEYSISSHYDSEYPSDERAKDLLDDVLNLFDLKNA